MKTTYIQLSLSAVLLLGIYSCKKGEATTTENYAADSTAAVSLFRQCLFCGLYESKRQTIHQNSRCQYGSEGCV